MTSVEQRKMIQKLKPIVTKMSADERRAFEMMVKRDRDDEDAPGQGAVALYDRRLLRRRHRQGREHAPDIIDPGRRRAADVL